MAVFRSIYSYQDFEQHVKAKVSPVTEYVHGGHDDEDREFLRTVLESSRNRMCTLANETLFRAQRAFGWKEEPIFDVAGSVVDTTRVEVACPLERMLPQSAFVSDGRVNRKGVPVLYLARDRETAVAETRPWIGQLITVAAFKLARECRLVDCSLNTKDSIWYEKLDLTGNPSTYTSGEKEIAVWGGIGHAFSTPIARDEPSSDYLPTQVLAE